MQEKQKCEKNYLEHKYHCAKCHREVSFSPANYASRPQDIPNWCLKCEKDNTSPQIQRISCVIELKK